MGPTLAGFVAWIYGVLALPATGVLVTTAQLPSNSPFLGYAFNAAFATVNPLLGLCTPAAPGVPPENLIYTLAVYNLAADNLINWCPDQSGQSFFKTLRGPAPTGYGITTWIAGVVTAAADEGTSDSLTTPEFMKNFTMGNLQNLKTPFGRQYLSFAQDFGPLWGLT